ncbi:MAG: class I SAM-dependent methyltransferase, partial [Saprospiraceae bacterium]
KYNLIENYRKKLNTDNTLINITDLGAGSRKIKKDIRKVSDISKTSVSNTKKCNIIKNFLSFTDSGNIIELGTSLGIMTSYLAEYTEANSIYTFEGDPNLAKIAGNTFSDLKISNIKLITGNFDDTLLLNVSKLDKINFAFIDGNHRKNSTINYFSIIKSKLNTNAIVVIDDIHWSKEMNEAWEAVKISNDVSASLDLYYFGILFFDKELSGDYNILI